jgi:hypothetical protein
LELGQTTPDNFLTDHCKKPLRRRLFYTIAGDKARQWQTSRIFTPVQPQGIGDMTSQHRLTDIAIRNLKP